MNNSNYLLLDNSEAHWNWTKDQLRAFKGNFCGIPMNLPYAPQGQLFTPAYVVYDTPTRQKIRETYKSLNLTHFPISLRGPVVYRNIYPNWDDSLINTYLSELIKDDIIPVCFAMADGDTVVQTHASPSLVPIVIPKWEDPNPIKAPALDQDNTFYLVGQRFPKALIYWHNPPGQDAPYIDQSVWSCSSDCNAKVWSFLVNQCHVQGLMFQGKAWIDPSNSISDLTDFINRLGSGSGGYPKADIIDFEETAYYTFDMNGSETQALTWTKQIWSSVGTHLNGYGNAQI